METHTIGNYPSFTRINTQEMKWIHCTEHPYLTSISCVVISNSMSIGNSIPGYITPYYRYQMQPPNAIFASSPAHRLEEPLASNSTYPWKWTGIVVGYLYGATVSDPCTGNARPAHCPVSQQLYHMLVIDQKEFPTIDLRRRSFFGRSRTIMSSSPRPSVQLAGSVSRMSSL